MQKEIEFIVEQRTTAAFEKSNKNGNSFSVENDRVNDAEVETNCKSGNASCYEHDQPDPFDEIPEKGVECQLAVIDIEMHNVALGRVFRSPTQASRSYGQAFGENDVRVSIEVVLEGKEDAELPVPTNEFFTVGDAVGSFVRWPKNLITFGHPKSNHEISRERSKKYTSRKQTKFDVGTSKKVESDKSKTKESMVRSNSTMKTLLNNKYDSRKLMSKVVDIIDDRQSSSLTLSEKVLGYKQTVFLSKDDMTQLLNMKRLSISCIQAFIGYGFICPQISSMVGQTVDEAATYISNRLKGGKKKIYLAPYYHDNHWMLAIIDIIEHNQVYWCDPIGNSEIPIFKTVLNTSIRVYGYEGGSRKSSKVPQWIKLDCARQPGKTECGYYIMRYMLEIVTSPNSMCSLDELFQDTTSYSQDEIDEVRDLWADYFLNA
ncbi:uncharacterized protein LOC141631627 [Silene latifolia]|uniref:uncharacterized protein LOC141631627 n=1 Tax=Silene latifolia TaxID=37657 RepID=UPI003D77F5F1